MTRFTFHVSRFIPCLLLALILLLAAVLRFHHLAAPSLWIDEQYSLEISTGHGYAHAHYPTGVLFHTPPDFTSLTTAAPVWKIWPHQAHDAHPPLYFLLLRLWRDLFGQGAFAARSLSAVLGILSVALVYLLARELAPGSSVPALWASLLLAVAGPELIAAQEVRSYTFATTLILLAALAAVAIHRRGWTRTRGLALTFATVAAFLTHYASAPPLIAIYAYLLFRSDRPTRTRALLALAAAVAIFAIAWGPWLPHQLRYIHEHHGRAIHPTRPERQLLLTAARFASLPLTWLADPTNPGPLLATGVVAFLLPFLLLKRHPSLLLPALWMLSAPLAIAAWDLIMGTAQLTHQHNLLLSAPALYLTLALLLAGSRNVLRHILPASAVLYCLVSLPRAYNLPIDYYRPHENWRDFAGRITAKCDPDHDAILYVCTGHMDWDAPAASLELCMHPYGHLPQSGAILNAPPSPQLLRQLQAYPTIWLVTGWYYPPLNQLLPNYTVADRVFFPDIRGGATKMVRTPTTRPTTKTSS